MEAHERSKLREDNAAAVASAAIATDADSTDRCAVPTVTMQTYAAVCESGQSTGPSKRCQPTTTGRVLSTTETVVVSFIDEKQGIQRSNV